VRCAAVPPRSSPIRSGFPRSFFRQTPFHQVLRAGERSFLLSSQDAAQFASYPHIEFLEYAFYLRETVVVNPASKDGREFFNELCDVASAASAKHFSEFVLQPLDALGGSLESRFLVNCHAVAQKLASARPVRRALGLIHPQLQPFFEESCCGGLHPFRRSFGPRVDVAVVGVPAERKARRSSSLSRPSSRMLLSSGDSGPPCGVPSVRSLANPCSIAPA